MQNIDKIIVESINHMIEESKKNTKNGKKSLSRLKNVEKSTSNAAKRIAKILGHKTLDSSEEGKAKRKKEAGKRAYQEKTKKDDKKKTSTRRRNIGNGRWVTYDFDQYQRDNVQSTEGDKSSILNTVDLDLVDLAAVARKVFPSHTDEGAQSQLRKIFKNERPMTKKVEYKLNQMISAGEIPTK